MKYIAVLLFTMMSLLSVGQVRTYVIEASDTLSTNNVLRINGDIFNSTTKVSVNDTTLVSLQYLASVLASTEGVDSLSFNPVTGYLSYYSGGAMVDSLLFDGRYLTTEVDGSITNELQSLSLITSGTDRTINIAGGTGVTFSVADNDNSSTNEIQDLSGSGANLSGYTISLSGDATTVTLPNESDPVYAIDSAFIVRFSDIDTLGFLRTETDPVYSSDSSNIVWFSDLDIIRSTVIEASDSLITRGVFQVGADKFKATTQVSSDDTTLVSLDYLTGLLDNAEYADSLAFHSGTGYLVYYRQGVALDSTSLDNRYVPYTGATTTVNLGSQALTTTGNVTGSRLISTVATGTAPLSVASTTQVVNLNSTYLGGRGVHSFVKYDGIGSTTYDANTFVEGGSVKAEYRWANTPGGIGVLRTYSYSPDWISQEFDAIGSTLDKYVRMRYSGTTWSDWYKVYHSGNFISGTHYQSPLTNPVTGTGTTNYLPKFTGLSTLGNSQIYDNGTNVGIGTTNPQFKLDVLGQAQFFSQFSTYAPDGLYSPDALPAITITTPGNKKILFGYRDFGFGNYYGRIGITGISKWSLGISEHAGNNFSIGLNNSLATDYLTITSGGNVGIGTTAPTQKLDVDGNIRVRGVGTNTTSTVLGLDSNGDLTTNVSITDRLLSATANTSFTFNITAYESASVSTNTNITVTFSNIVSGRRGSIEVIYTGASVITFTIPSGYALYIGSTLYNSGTGLSKTVLSKSTGNAVYNYYVSGTNIYIDGNQNYN